MFLFQKPMGQPIFFPVTYFLSPSSFIYFEQLFQKMEYIFIMLEQLFQVAEYFFNMLKQMF